MKDGFSGECRSKANSRAADKSINQLTYQDSPGHEGRVLGRVKVKGVGQLGLVAVQRNPQRLFYQWEATHT